LPVSSRKQLHFTKEVYAYQQKTQEQIYKVLNNEVDRLVSNNPGYRLYKFGKPVKNKMGGLLYRISLVKNGRVK